jgi:hypothetical protein
MFCLGTVFGSTVAAVVSFVMFQIIYGNIEQSKILGIQDCLMQRLEVVDE